MQDAEEAFRWCCQAAAQGLAEAQRQVGDLCHAGNGVAADVALTAAWLKRRQNKRALGP